MHINLLLLCIFCTQKLTSNLLFYSTGSGGTSDAAIVGGVAGVVFLIFVILVIFVCVVTLYSIPNCRARARRAAPAVQMTSIPAQTTSATTGAYTQSQPEAQNQPPPPSYSAYMEQQKPYSQQTAPIAYPGYAAPAGYPTQGYGYPAPAQQGFAEYPQQDYSQTGYPQQVHYPQQQQQEAPVGYPQQEPQGYGGTNPGTDEFTGIHDEPPPPY